QALGGLIPEEADLIGRALLLRRSGDGRQHACTGKRLGAVRFDRLERSGLRERLETSPVDKASIDAFRKILQVLEKPILARCLYGRHGRLPNALDGAMRIADSPLFHSAVGARIVDARRPYFHTHPARFLEEHG